MTETRRRDLGPLRPHPTRDQILDLMQSYGEPMSPTGLADALGATLGSIAYHVRALHSAGILDPADDGRVRGAVEHFYTVSPDRQVEIDRARQLLALCGCLSLLSSGGGPPKAVVVDDAARTELDAVLDELRARVMEIAERAVGREEGRRRPSGA